MVNVFVKHCILDVSQGSEYAPVICYSLFGKIEVANQAWILAPDIRQCLANNRVVSDKMCFTVDTAVWCFIYIYIYTDILKFKHSVSTGLSCSGFSFYEYFNRQFIRNHKNLPIHFLPILYWFFALLGTAYHLKTFYMSLHSTKNWTKYNPPLTLYTRKVK